MLLLSDSFHVSSQIQDHDHVLLTHDCYYDFYAMTLDAFLELTISQKYL